MKITDVTLTLFRWENLPEAKYMGGAGSAGREVQMGLVTITTDEGIEGHSFLGASMRGANLDGVSLIDKLKPCLIGQNPLERERLYREMWRRNRHTTLRCPLYRRVAGDQSKGVCRLQNSPADAVGPRH